jgi:hypothetical protein
MHHLDAGAVGPHQLSTLLGKLTRPARLRHRTRVEIEDSYRRKSLRHDRQQQIQVELRRSLMGKILNLTDGMARLERALRVCMAGWGAKPEALERR